MGELNGSRKTRKDPDGNLRFQTELGPKAKPNKAKTKPKAWLHQALDTAGLCFVGGVQAATSLGEIHQIEVGEHRPPAKQQKMGRTKTHLG